MLYQGHKGAALGEEQVRLLTLVDIFEPLFREEIEEIEWKHLNTSVEEGETFYTPIDPCETLFVLQRGRVRIFRATPEGREFTVAVIGSGTDFEREVYSHYGLEQKTTEDRGSYGDYHEDDPEPTTDAGATTMTTTGEDELRVQRSEEELRAGTREREAGSLRVRKRVRTDREQIEVPTRHEEVSVERVPVEGEASEAEIGEDEVEVPVTEEEVVVEKRPVVKEEVRVRKDVVEDTEVVEDEVRREEVEIEDSTERRNV